MSSIVSVLVASARKHGLEGSILKVFQINNNREIVCRNCGRQVRKGEQVARSTNHDHYRDRMEKPRYATPYLCADCYTYPSGERIIT